MRMDIYLKDSIVSHCALDIPRYDNQWESRNSSFCLPSMDLTPPMAPSTASFPCVGLERRLLFRAKSQPISPRHGICILEPPDVQTTALNLTQPTLKRVVGRFENRSPVSRCTHRASSILLSGSFPYTFPTSTSTAPLADTSLVQSWCLLPQFLSSSKKERGRTCCNHSLERGSPWRLFDNPAPRKTVLKHVPANNTSRRMITT